MNAVVSVIIPNKNKASRLRACIQSCIAQGSALKEIIVIDDGSDDDSMRILREIRAENPSLIQLFDNGGKGANNARNLGFEKSSGAYIQWLDSDDLLLEGKFDNQLPVLKSDVADIVYSDQRIDYYDKSGMVKSEVKQHRPYRDYLCELIKDNWSSPNNYLMRREAASMTANGNGWNSETLVSQDREYFTIAGILGARFSYVPGVFSVYNKQSSGTVSAVNFNWRLEQNQILEARLRKEILSSSRMNNRTKRTYLRILDTHLAKACFYHSGLRYSRWINPLRIRYDLMHWKMRLVMPFLVLRKNIQYLF